MFRAQSLNGSSRSCLRGVLLDVDGTLVDSNDAHARSWVDVLSAHGVGVPYEDVRRRIGMGGDKMLPALTGISDESELGRRMNAERARMFRERYLPRIRALPGSRSLVERMRSEGLALAVASSAKKEELQPLLEIAGVADLVAEATSSDDAERSKPDPDIVRAALERLGCDAREAVLIGDTPYDIEAAAKLGMGSIAFRCGGWADDGLAGALAVYENPADLLAHYEESPLSRRA